MNVNELLSQLFPFIRPRNNNKTKTCKRIIEKEQIFNDAKNIFIEKVLKQKNRREEKNLFANQIIVICPLVHSFFEKEKASRTENSETRLILEIH